MNKLLVKLDESQSHLIQEALDHYTRTALGQFDKMADWIIDMHPEAEERKAEIEEALQLLSKAVLPKFPFHGSHGIFAPDVIEDARIAHDIRQVLRYETNKAYRPHLFDDPIGSKSTALPWQTSVMKLIEVGVENECVDGEKDKGV